MPACRPRVPFPLPSGYLTDSEAELYEYGNLRELLGATIASGCECAEAPEEPACDEGCSKHRVTSTFCPPLWLFGWQLIESCPPRVCGEDQVCTPTVPEDLTLPTGPITEEEATAWPGGSLFDKVGTDHLGGCSCSAEPYVAPTCPECDCSTITHAWQFFVNAEEGTSASAWNGGYNIFKGGTPGDECDGCCWNGGADFNLAPFGSFTRLITPFGIYLTGQDVCDDPLVLTLDSGGIDGSPLTLTLVGI